MVTSLVVPDDGSLSNLNDTSRLVDAVDQVRWCGSPGVTRTTSPLRRHQLGELRPSKLLGRPLLRDLWTEELAFS